MPAAFEQLNLAMEMAGDEKVGRGFNNTNTKVNQLRTNISRFGEQIGKTQSRINFFAGYLAAGNSQLREFASNLGLMESTPYQARSQAAQFVGFVGTIATAEAGYRFLGRLGEWIGSAFGTIGATVGKFAGEIVGLLVGKSVGEKLAKWTDKAYDWIRRDVFLGVGLTGDLGEKELRKLNEDLPFMRGVQVKAQRDMPRNPFSSVTDKINQEYNLKKQAESEELIKKLKDNPLLDILKTKNDFKIVFDDSMKKWFADRGASTNLIELLKTREGQKWFLSNKPDEFLQTTINREIDFKVEMKAAELRNELRDILKFNLKEELETRDRTFTLLNEYFGA